MGKGKYPESPTEKQDSSRSADSVLAKKRGNDRYGCRGKIERHYSITETAKANNLKPYDYFEYLLSEIQKHLDDTERSFLDDLLSWSPKLPANCRKPGKEVILWQLQTPIFLNRVGGAD